MNPENSGKNHLLHSHLSSATVDCVRAVVGPPSWHTVSFFVPFFVLTSFSSTNQHLTYTQHHCQARATAGLLEDSVQQEPVSHVILYSTLWLLFFEIITSFNYLITQIRIKKSMLFCAYLIARQTGSSRVKQHPQQVRHEIITEISKTAPLDAWQAVYPHYCRSCEYALVFELLAIFFVDSHKQLSLCRWIHSMIHECCSKEIPKLYGGLCSNSWKR